MGDALLKALVRVLVRGFYRRVDARDPGNLPGTGPVLLTANHPNSLLDSLAIGSVAGRRVHFVAKHTLFRFPLKPLLDWAGVIPIRRRQDLAEVGLSPEEARKLNDETFEACYRVLERGDVVGIFPEGITHDAPRLAPVKTGPARIALGAEARNAFGLGLVILPVGLHFPKKAVFRSEAVLSFGKPIRVSEWQARHKADPREAVRELTEALEVALKGLILEIPEEDERLVQDVLGIYADRLPPAPGEQAPSPAADDLERARRVAAAVARTRQEEPALLESLGGELRKYHRLLERLGLSDRTLGRSLSPSALREEGLPRLALLLVGLPLALYGLLNHLLASRLAALSVRLFARKSDQTMVALQRLMGGVVGIPLTYALQTLAVERASASWTLALGYLASLPASGLFAWWWMGKLARARVTWEEGSTLLAHRWLLGKLRRRRVALRRALDEARERGYHPPPSARP